MGIRVALGARRGQVIGAVLRHGLLLDAVGGGADLAGASLLGDLLEAISHDVRATDPTVLAGVAVLLSAAALVACYLPARRAATADPIETLRIE